MQKLILSNASNVRNILAALATLSVLSFGFAILALIDTAANRPGEIDRYVGFGAILLLPFGLTLIAIQQYRNMVRSIELGDKVVIRRQCGDSIHDWDAISVMREHVGQTNRSLFIKFSNGDYASVRVTRPLLDKVNEMVVKRNPSLLLRRNVGNRGVSVRAAACEYAWGEQIQAGNVELVEHERYPTLFWHGQLRPSGNVDAIVSALQRLNPDGDVLHADRTIHLRLEDGRSGTAHINSIRFQSAHIFDFVGLGDLD